MSREWKITEFLCAIDVQRSIWIELHCSDVRSTEQVLYGCAKNTMKDMAGVMAST